MNGTRDVHCSSTFTETGATPTQRGPQRVNLLSLFFALSTSKSRHWKWYHYRVRSFTRCTAGFFGKSGRGENTQETSTQERTWRSALCGFRGGFSCTVRMLFFVSSPVAIVRVVDGTSVLKYDRLEWLGFTNCLLATSMFICLGCGSLTAIITIAQQVWPDSAFVHGLRDSAHIFQQSGPFFF